MAVRTVHVLSLCAGIGGLDLGVRLAVPGARTVCYVEREVYAAAVLAARMADGALDDAPVWSDLATFDGEPWRGVVDCVVAGFPCQPFSVAGRRRGVADARWLWPDIARVIREVGPRYVFLENVPGLVRHGLGHVLADLAAFGFAAEWDGFSASEVGAPHIRERWFLLADAGCGGNDAHEPECVAERDGTTSIGAGRNPVANALADAGCEALDNPDGARLATGERKASGPVRDEARWEEPRGRRDALADALVRGWGTGERDDGAGQPDAVGVGAVVADAASARWGEGRAEPAGREWQSASDIERLPLFPPGPGDAIGWRSVLAVAPGLKPAVRGLAVGATPGLDGRAVHHRVDQLRALGNAVVPLTAAVAFVTLWRRLHGVD